MAKTTFVQKQAVSIVPGIIGQVTQALKTPIQKVFGQLLGLNSFLASLNGSGTYLLLLVGWCSTAISLQLKRSPLKKE